MTNWKYLKSLNEEQFANWLYEFWLKEHMNYTDSRVGLISYLTQERQTDQNDLNTMAVNVLKDWLK